MDLGEAMVLKGYAWPFVKYSDIYTPLTAKSERFDVR
jgi:hypothetical protein